MNYYREKSQKHENQNDFINNNNNDGKKMVAIY